MVLLQIIPSRARAQLRWVDHCSSRPLPWDALRGGQEPARELFICRARYAGGWHPGKVVDGNCNCGYGGREIIARNYQVLRGFADLQWVHRDELKCHDRLSPEQGYVYSESGNLVSAERAGGYWPRSAQWFPFKGGNEACGTPLIVAAANYGSRGLHPGKIVSNYCNFGYGGREILGRDYYVLMVRGQCH